MGSLRQSLAPGAGTPIHEHDCEELFLVEEGHVTCQYIGRGSSAVQSRTAIANQTIYIPPNWRHRIINEHPKEETRYLVVLSNPPMQIRVFGAWGDRDPVRPQGLHIFDLSCPSHGPYIR